MTIPRRIQDLIDRGALFVVNHSGGKDSQAMFLFIRRHVPADQIVLVHAELPGADWSGILDHIADTTFGAPLHTAVAIDKSGRTKSFFDMVRSRGFFPSPRQRQCTSDLKRGPIEKVIRRISRDTGRRLIVSCDGRRAQESADRAKLPTFTFDDRNSKAGREWYNWLPIHDLLIDDVFAMIADAGQAPHWAYAAGMSRLSCCFCIMSSQSDLQTAARLRPDLLREYAALEREIDQTMFMPRAGVRRFLDDQFGLVVAGFVAQARSATDDLVDPIDGLVVDSFDLVAAAADPDPDPDPVVILSYGGGVDSTAILAAHLWRDAAARVLQIARDDLDVALPAIDHVVFADTGAESRRTYRNVETAQRLCADAGIPFTIVRKHDRDGNVYRIQDHHLRLGTLPVMPGCGHVCSIKFKQDAIKAWKRDAFTGRQTVSVIGYEANERTRCAKAGRFQPEAGTSNLYPLIDLDMDRARCDAFLALVWPHAVVKSSCVFCPFMTEAEIVDLYRNEPESWQLVRDLESALRRESDRKHGAYLAAMAAHEADPAANPSPLNRAGKCRTGFWSKHTWNEGLRVFWGAKVKGRALSCDEWEARITAANAAPSEKEPTAMPTYELRAVIQYTDDFLEAAVAAGEAADLPLHTVVLSSPDRGLVHTAYAAIESAGGDLTLPFRLAAIWTDDEILIDIVPAIAGQLMVWAKGDWTVRCRAADTYPVMVWIDAMDRGDYALAVLPNDGKWRITPAGLSWILDCAPELIAEQWSDGLVDALQSYRRRTYERDTDDALEAQAESRLFGNGPGQ